MRWLEWFQILVKARAGLRLVVLFVVVVEAAVNDLEH
jgi:hypothetical protein